MEVHPRVDLISRTVITASGDMFHFCLIFLHPICMCERPFRLQEPQSEFRKLPSLSYTWHVDKPSIMSKKNRISLILRIFFTILAWLAHWSFGPDKPLGVVGGASFWVLSMSKSFNKRKEVGWNGQNTPCAYAKEALCQDHVLHLPRFRQHLFPVPLLQPVRVSLRAVAGTEDVDWRIPFRGQLRLPSVVWPTQRYRLSMH